MLSDIQWNVRYFRRKYKQKQLIISFITGSFLMRKYFQSLCVLSSVMLFGKVHWKCAMWYCMRSRGKSRKISWTTAKHASKIMLSLVHYFLQNFQSFPIFWNQMAYGNLLISLSFYPRWWSMNFTMVDKYFGENMAQWLLANSLS